MLNNADELLVELRQVYNAAQKTPSVTVSAILYERAAHLAVRLDHWVTRGNPPPLDWGALIQLSREVNP